MPAARLYGRRWHFSTDITPVAGGLGLLYHLIWALFLLVGAAASGQWPGHCSSGEGIQYVVLFGGCFAACIWLAIVEVHLVIFGSRGAPLEESKRRAVVPLLYAGTPPLVAQLALTAYGTYVTTALEADCWEPSVRGRVQDVAQALVFSTWGFVFLTCLALLLFFNAYPEHSSIRNWEQRCECVAMLLCCRANVKRMPDGKRAPIHNIAELAAGLLSHIDVEATDMAAALVLTAAAQTRRRRLRVAKALLPVYSAALQQAADEESGRDDASESSVNDIPTECELDKLADGQPEPPHPAGHERASGAASMLPAAQQQQQSASLEQFSAAESEGRAVERLAEAIREEIEALGGDSLSEEAAVQLSKEASLDLEAVRIDPEHPTIFFRPSSGASGGSAGSNAPAQQSAQAESQQPLDEAAARSEDGRDVLERQVTLRYPAVIITPTEHISDFAGPLPSEALADLVPGRQERVSAAVLHDLLHFLKYSYAVYALKPKYEEPASLTCFKPPAPEEVVLKALGELEHMVLRDNEITMLYMNCSNAVLAHLPYFIALDHAKRAVILSIRGTISVADLVTDAVVYPERVDNWVPDDLKELLLGQPAFAHAGMVSAAKAIFTDMTQRGILLQLERSVGCQGNAAPPQHTGNLRQQAQYDAETGQDGAAMSTPFGQHHGSGATSTAGRRCFCWPGAADAEEAPGPCRPSLGRQVGEAMRQKIEDEGWQFVVQGHSLGAGVAALLSLHLRQHFPRLKCIAYSCPGGLVSSQLAQAMASFTTTRVAVGKDAVPRMTVATLRRLMDEMVTALARCRQPKLKVLFYPWWRRNRQRFSDLFYRYSDIPAEARAALRAYHESASALGRPMGMYPPGRLAFLRPLKARGLKQWEAVWIRGNDLIGEGILVSKHMLNDHLCSHVSEALRLSLYRAEMIEQHGIDPAITIPLRRVLSRHPRMRAVLPDWVLRRLKDASGGSGLRHVLVD